MDKVDKRLVLLKNPDKGISNEAIEVQIGKIIDLKLDINSLKIVYSFSYQNYLILPKGNNFDSII